uniref:Uncharacterized protein n=1 Tax=Tanacetum cinerariifolium TaxID=118510 RepID=A0A6L2KX70_TANCI|nr:hypothetical protein [Tanacetum cinerariifolium]
MVAILEKGEHNVAFYPMVDFIEVSPLRIETTEEGTKILATVDGIVRTVSESSLRQNLKLRDEEGISSLPDTKLFKNLTLMGYNISPNQKFTFQKGSGTASESHHTPSPKAPSPSHTTHTSPSLPPVTTTSIPTVTLTETNPIRQYTRRARIAQSSALPTVADESASPQRDVNQGEACPTDSGFIADQDRTTIAKSSTLPHDSAPRVPSPAAVKSSMQQTILELTALCTSLQRQLSELTGIFQAQEVEINRLKEKVNLLEEREGVDAKSFGDDTLIKRRILASGVVDIPTGSGSILTASTPIEEQVPTGSDVVPTASPVFATATVVTRELEEQLEREDQRRSEQISRDAEIAKIHVEEELQIMINGLDRNNETVAKYLQEYHQFALELLVKRRIELISDLVKYQDHYVKVHKYQSQLKKPRTKKQNRDYYMAVIRNNLGWKIEGGVTKISKEEAAWIKRKGIRLEQDEVKKIKTSEEVPEEVKLSEEVSEEKIKEMIQLVPIEEVYVEALQVKNPIIDWKVQTEGQRTYWQITRLGGSSASYQFFTDLLKHLDRDDLNQLWILVKETLSNRPPTSDKEREL